jgi:hypothetical protein
MNATSGQAFVPPVPAFEFCPVQPNFLHQRGTDIGRTDAANEMTLEGSVGVKEIIDVVRFDPENLWRFGSLGVPEVL